MKTTNKKIFGGLIVVSIIATIGVVFASAQDDEITEDFNPQENFWDRHHINGPGFFNKNLTKHGPFFYDLTEEQQTELNELITDLKDQGANDSEIKTAIQEKLDEFGVLDQRLDSEINQTEQRLQILNREKELRDQGYSWDEIRTIIQDEFGIDSPIPYGDHGMKGPHGFGREPCGGPDDFMSGEESKQ